MLQVEFSLFHTVLSDPKNMPDFKVKLLLQLLFLTHVLYQDGELTKVNAVPISVSLLFN